MNEHATKKDLIAMNNIKAPNHFATESHDAMTYVVNVITSNGTKWPAAVTKLIEQHQAVRTANANIPRPTPPSPGDWKLNGLEDLSSEIALELAVEAHRRDALGLIAAEVDRELRSAIVASWPSVHATLAAKFGTHAQAYTEAVQLIPPTADHPDIAKGSPKLMAAYSTARLEASELGALLNVMRAVEGSLRLSDGGQAPRSLDVCVPSSYAQALEITGGKPRELGFEHEVSGAIRLLDARMFCAVKTGAPLALQNYVERRRLVESWSDSPRRKNNK